VQDNASRPQVGVIVPCFNEELTVGGVVRDFSRALPDARIYVFDNCSSDRTAELARQAGAEVIVSPRRGKGNVIRHAQRTVDADIYIFVDGDGTYLAAAAPQLIERLETGEIDMLVASRLERAADGSFRRFHLWGNTLISRTVSVLFSANLTDVLSGYRVLTRQALRLVRLRGTGFEVETEMTLQALAKGCRVEEIPVHYGARPAGSQSKLSTWGDGFVILKCLFLIFKDYRPLLFFSAAAVVLAVASVAFGIGPILEYFRTGLVNQVPRAILAAGLGGIATISLAVGLILDTIAKYHEENTEFWKLHLRELDTSRVRPRRADDQESR
jgi:glycosyltransferase involved in cell wall biosynthesis